MSFFRSKRLEARAERREGEARNKSREIRPILDRRGPQFLCGLAPAYRRQVFARRKKIRRAK
jgi:hypothetical protein